MSYHYSDPYRAGLLPPYSAPATDTAVQVAKQANTGFCPAPTTPLVSTAQRTFTPQPCDPLAFAEWWSTLPIPPEDIRRLTDYSSDYYRYENRVARNTDDTFFGMYPKRIAIPGAQQAIGADYNTLDADGATRTTCRLVDAKYDSGGGGYTTPFMKEKIHDEVVELLKRYRYAITMYNQPIALEIRTNTVQAQSSFIQWVSQAGFELRRDVFVELYP